MISFIIFELMTLIINKYRFLIPLIIDFRVLIIYRALIIFNLEYIFLLSFSIFFLIAS